MFKTKNASGGTGTSRRSAGRRYSGRHALWLCVVAAVIASAFVVIPFAARARTRDISGFELDGNVAHDAATTPPDDWATLFNASGQSTGARQCPFARTFVADGYRRLRTPALPAAGRKRTPATSPNWGWSDTGVTPAKDDIANAYAAAYAEQGNEIIYFGQERVDNAVG